MNPPELLFCEGDIGDSLERHRADMVAEIGKAPEDYLLNVDIDEWVTHLVAEYSVEAPTLHVEDMWVEDEGEASVDVSHEHFTRAISDPTRPAFVKGRRVKLHIPYAGESIFFKLSPSRRTLNPPRATIGKSDLHVVFEYPTDTARPDIAGQGRSLAATIEQHLEWQRPTCEAHNARLENDARSAIQLRRERVLADHSHLDGLGIPVRKRGDAPTTYQAPAVKRRSAPARESATREKPGAPEPTLVKDMYDHTLEVIASVARAMERTPGDYARAGEEKLRDNLLIVLNTHYEGSGQAEAFNKSGKTDILIRVEDRNIFIAECKIWKGAKSLTEALDQLSGYATWRDTKLALVFFVRQKAIDPVVEKARKALGDWEGYRYWVNADEGELRCRIAWPDDADREADLALFFVHLPGS